MGRPVHHWPCRLPEDPTMAVRADTVLPPRHGVARQTLAVASQLSCRRNVILRLRLPVFSPPRWRLAAWKGFDTCSTCLSLGSLSSAFAETMSHLRRSGPSVRSGTPVGSCWMTLSRPALFSSSCGTLTSKSALE